MTKRRTEEWLAAARAGASVWLGDVKAACAAMPEADRMVLRLTELDGSLRDFTLCLPPWEGEAERAFVLEYLSACVFNILSALSGRGVCFYYHRGDARIEKLLDELERVLQLDEKPRSGCGKAVTVAERLSGGAFRFGREPLSAYVPLPAETGKETNGGLAGMLRRAVGRADGLRCCGLDVGGTDIKLAMSENGRLLLTREYDWDPSAFRSAEDLIAPILRLTEEAACACGARSGFDAIGLSFPDVVIRNRILGGETPKTRGMRESCGADYEKEFSKISGLAERLRASCAPGGCVAVTNDGNMAAVTYAAELACSGNDAQLEHGVFAHTLGTDLGSGWLLPDGSVPELPLEMYDFLTDLGSYPQRELPPGDLRSVRNENSGLPGARRYLGQAACFRMAQELDPAMLDGFAVTEGEVLRIASGPNDLRKPCLEHLMALAEAGRPEAEEIFRRVGRHLGQLSREMQEILKPETNRRCLFGRFVKRPGCFRLICEGCAEVLPELELVPADENLAASPLMRQLAERKDATVAQFGQAVGAIYYALMEEEA